MAARGGILAILVFICSCAAAAAPAAEPAVTAISPLRDNGHLACRILTSGLPGERLLSSMRSGIVSAVDLEVDVLDAHDRRVASALVTFQLAFDLWDEIFSVRVEGREHRLDDLAALRAWLARPPEIRLLPVADLRLMDEPLVLRGSLTLHPIAPRDRLRVQDVIAGTGAEDRNEATVSFGKLIRFFYRDQDKANDPTSAVRSRPFAVEELSHAVAP